MFAQQAALSAYARAAVMFGDPAYRRPPIASSASSKTRWPRPAAASMPHMGMSEGEPGVDKRQYARESAQAIAALLAYYDATGVTEARGVGGSLLRVWVIRQPRDFRWRLPPRRTGQGRTLSG